MVGFGTHAQTRRVEVEAAKRPAAIQRDGMSALVTTLSAEEDPTDQVFGLFTEPQDVERSQHLLTGPLRGSPVSLKKPMRSEGLRLMLGWALVALLLRERQDRKPTKVPQQNRRTTSHILEVCEGEAWVLIKGPAGSYRRPSVLTAAQQEIYTALALNPP